MAKISQTSLRTSASKGELSAMWSRHHAQWRDPAQIVSHWQDASQLDERLLRQQAHGGWWSVLSDLKITLLVTREYENLVMAMTVKGGKPLISYLPMPHPSGMVFDQAKGILNIASTRNPNEVFELSPVNELIKRVDQKSFELREKPLVPVRSSFYPGCLYMHDLAIIGGELFANSVGQNAIIHLDENGGYKCVWYPKCIETQSGPVFGQNHLQLNSIAAGESLEKSFFSASSDRISARRPGHKNFPVDRRGVIFSAATREPIAKGLTRPHSARLHNGKIWVDNSGYGQLGLIEGSEFVPAVRLPGWTRGLSFCKDIAFVGTSMVIPKFRQYAPGLKVEDSVCGLHAVHTKSGKILGSLTWSHGNQIFAIECVPSKFCSGLPFSQRSRPSTRDKKLFYAYSTETD